MLKGTDTRAMGNFINNYNFPAMQYTQTSPLHTIQSGSPQSLATDFEQQQQIFHAQQGVNSPGVVVPNALCTSVQGDASFDRPRAQQGVHGPIGWQLGFQPEGTLRAAKVAPTPMRCEWPSCRKETFFITEHFTQHLHRHRDEPRDSFVVPGVCQWPGCRSRKSGVTFQTETDFDRHLKLHMKSHWCDVPGCKHGEGFARQYDLTRHLRTHSKERAFNCPDSSCASSSLGFSRKDKLDAHIRTRHPHLMRIVQSRRCDVHGCTVKKSFDSIEDLQTHFETAHEHHRPHRCRVEECTRYNNGFTTRGRLVEHIKAEHEPPKCTFDHCDFRSLGYLMVEHNQRFHYAHWECKLSGCKGSKSKFSYERFRSHLFDHHGICRPSYKQMCAARYRGDKGFSPYNRMFVTCKYCSEHRVQSDQNEVSRDETA